MVVAFHDNIPAHDDLSYRHPVGGNGHASSIDDAKLGNLTGLLAKIRPAVSASGAGSAKDDAYVNKVAEANVSQAMKEIREKSPTIKAQLDAGTVGLVGAIYDVSTGKVTFLPD